MIKKGEVDQWETLKKTYNRQKNLLAEQMFAESPYGASIAGKEWCSKAPPTLRRLGGLEGD